MSNQDSQNSLIAKLDETVDDALKYFTEVGQNSEARVGDWGAWEILCHMIFWHRATAEGIESVASGDTPRQIKIDTDEANAHIIESMSGKTMDELANEVRSLQTRLVSAFRSISDPTSTVFIRLSGEESSANERLQMIAGHWREHVAELKEAN